MLPRKSELLPHPDFDYLVIGHIVRDRTAEAFRLGGTAAYASMTATALGRRAAVLSSFNHQLDLTPLKGAVIHNIPSTNTTTFENQYTCTGRLQTLTSLAEPLTSKDVPLDWRHTPLVHIGPVTQQVSPDFLESFPESWIGLTPQGWLRTSSAGNLVQLQSWQTLDSRVSAADAVVLSREDLQNDIDAEEALAKKCRILAVTDANNGAFLYHKNRRTHVPAPEYTELDPTGCGDIFAAVFFVGLQQGLEIVQAARAATRAAARAVTRRGLASVPSNKEASRIRNFFQL